MRVVLDTNVLVSGLLNPYAAPGEIVRITSSGLLELCYDSRIINEYREVLKRPRFGFDAELVGAFVDEIEGNGLQVVGEPLRLRLPDPDDEPFLEAAIAGRAEYLITGNIKHYPSSSRQKIRVLGPAAFLEAYRRR